MRLKTKLVLAAAAVTFAIVVVLSGLFLKELLRQRIEQTAANNELMARQVLQMTRQAVEVGLTANPPTDTSPEALQAAVADALRTHKPLLDTMDSFVRYSPSVQDVSVTDSHGWTLVSTDPQMWNQPATARVSFDRVRDASVSFKIREVFGQAHVLDVSAPLDRNGAPFLVVHMGLRSTFLKANYVPWLKDAFFLVLSGAFITMIASAVLASLALRPIEDISRKLERLSGGSVEDFQPLALGIGKADAVVRVTESIDRLGIRMRTTEAGYTDLQANLDKMLDTLRDGVVLFTAEGRVVMVSDAVANFVAVGDKPLVGRSLRELFAGETALGDAVLAAFEHGRAAMAETVRMEGGREVEFSLDRIDDGAGGGIGTLLTLRDTGSAMRLEQELEVSRRLAAVGRLTAGVGHEVKNPINAMVVHLELLRSKLAAAENGDATMTGAQRHVDVLAGEMARLDRVVQTLADFTRPMELRVEEMDLTQVVDAVVELTSEDMEERGVLVEVEAEPVMVRADGEMLRQALLNLVLNGMQAMPEGGRLQIKVQREQNWAVIQIADDGEGIAPELMPRIFELYFTTKAKGSGIGLAMTYRIVQMHGGAMEVISEAGQGAVFTMRLPVVEGRASVRTVRSA
jgi:signal transduction histidine kinase